MRSMFYPWLFSSVLCKGWVRTLELGTALMQGSRMQGIRVGSTSITGTVHITQVISEQSNNSSIPGSSSSSHRASFPHPCRPRSGDWASQGCPALFVGLLYLAHISVHLFIKLSLKLQLLLSPAPESWLTRVGQRQGSRRRPLSP